MDKSMNNLLKWGIENSAAASNAAGTDAEAAAAAPRKELDTEALQHFLANSPSDAELMKGCMEIIRSPGDEISLENKLIAFNNFEQLVESLDNSNNMEVLGLWTPLVETLDHEDSEMRMMAAWCIGTAVQNNEKSQDRVCLPFFPCPAILLDTNDFLWNSSSSSTASPTSSGSRNPTPTKRCAERPSTRSPQPCATTSPPSTN